MKLSAIAMLGMGLLCGTVVAATDQNPNQNQSQDQNQPQQPVTVGSASDAEKNKKEGEDFLAKNKARKEVTTLKDGLQYEVLNQGSGPKPNENSMVVVNYKGNLIDGTEFDSPYKRGQPVTFRVTQVIPGWVEALKLMKE